MFGSGNTKPTRPTFPTFLLPSIPIPFRKRKTSASNPTTSTTSPPFQPESYSFSINSTSPPSLCTSPASTGSSPPSSPTSPTTFFPALSNLLPWSSSPSSPPKLSRFHPDTLRCANCSADLAFGAQIVSKGFTGRHGRAYLVSPPPNPNPNSGGATADLANIRIGRPEHRQLVTGSHVVADISCVLCNAKLGWKYVDAKESGQRYKIGKFILETARVVGFRSWEDGDGDGSGKHRGGRGAGRVRGSVDASWFSAREGEEVCRASGGDDKADVDAVVFDSGDEDECEDIFAGTWDAEVVAKRRKSKVGPPKKRHAGM